MGVTLPKTNSKFAPENGWLEYDEVSFWGGILAYFRGRCLLLSGRLFFFLTQQGCQFRQSQPRCGGKLSGGDGHEILPGFSQNVMFGRYDRDSMR